MYRAIIADDEINILEGISKVVAHSNLGIEIVGTAQDGQKTLELFEKHLPDLIIIDINMPKLSGLECIEQIKKLNKDVIIIIISSYDSFHFAQQAISLKVNSYILKPINEENLIREIKRTLYPEAPVNNDNIAVNFTNFINKNFSNTDLSSEMIEKEFGLSRTSIFKIMKVVTDKSLIEYITMIRIRKAISFIRQNPKITLKEIANACGYQDPFYFSKVFKKQTGQSFVDYKKIIGGHHD